jgi:hypothetical protein
VSINFAEIRMPWFADGGMAFSRECHFYCKPKTYHKLDNENQHSSTRLCRAICPIETGVIEPPRLYKLMRATSGRFPELTLARTKDAASGESSHA